MPNQGQNDLGHQKLGSLGLVSFPQLKTPPYGDSLGGSVVWGGGAGGSMNGGFGGAGGGSGGENKYLFNEINRLRDEHGKAIDDAIASAKADLKTAEQGIGTQIGVAIEKTSSEIRREIFTVMGMFFTIFAFVSFSIQIFSRVDDVVSAAIILCPAGPGPAGIARLQRRSHHSLQR